MPDEVIVFNRKLEISISCRGVRQERDVGLGMHISDCVLREDLPRILRLAAYVVAAQKPVRTRTIGVNTGLWNKIEMIPTSGLDASFMCVGVYMPRTWDRLTQKEIEVIEAYRIEMSRDCVAERLGITLNTLATHRRSIIAKLDISDHAEFHHFCARYG